MRLWFNVFYIMERSERGGRPPRGHYRGRVHSGGMRGGREVGINERGAVYDGLSQEGILEVSMVKIDEMRAIHEDNRRAVYDIVDIPESKGNAVKSMKLVTIGKDDENSTFIGKPEKKYFLIDGSAKYEPSYGIKGGELKTRKKEGELSMIQRIVLEPGQEMKMIFSSGSKILVAETGSESDKGVVDYSKPLHISLDDSKRQGNLTTVSRLRADLPIRSIKAIFTKDDNSEPLGGNAHYDMNAEFLVVEGEGEVSLQKTEKVDGNKSRPVEGAEEIRYNLKTGDVVVVPVGWAHTLKMEPGSKLIASYDKPFDPGDIYPLEKPLV